jgi:hypothetical protein
MGRQLRFDGVGLLGSLGLQRPCGAALGQHKSCRKRESASLNGTRTQNENEFSNAVGPEEYKPDASSEGVTAWEKPAKPVAGAHSC